jgi:putative MATE family efflux protein
MPNQQIGAAAARLGTEKVGKLLLQFSIPAIVGMLVQALYNIVDRFWVGRGVGEIALGGLSLCLPLMTITMAFSMLFGMGSANLISLRLGEGKKDEAENALNHNLLLLAGFGLLMMVLQLRFLDPLMSILGAQPGSQSLVYARSYYAIICYGQIFSMVGFGFSNCTRAQGFPNITMIGMFIGAGLNMILDPIFIILMGWGVEGAAWATIISQTASCIFLLIFAVNKRAVVRLHPSHFHPSWKIVMTIIAFGSSQFLMQFVMSAIQLLVNSSFGWYGARDLGVANGGDIALSGANIVGSVTMLVLMPIFGLNQGGQPIMGFNYGAKQYRRVLQAFKCVVIAATAITTVGWLVCQLFPQEIIRLFAPHGSPALMRFAPLAMRAQNVFLLTVGFQIVAGNMFVVTGRPKMSIFLSLIRQMIVLIPCLLIFGRLWGLWGILAAQPVSDFIALLIIGIVTIREVKHLQKAALGEQQG